MLRNILLASIFILLTPACDDDPKTSNNVNNTNNTNNLNNLNNVTEYEAIPGARCTQENRVGTVTVGSWAGGNLDLSVQIYDAPVVPRSAMAFSDDACAFWEEVQPGFCEPECGLDEMCDHTGTCRPLPAPVEDLLLTLQAGEQTQLFEPQYVGQLYGPITLSGRDFSATLVFSGLTVHLPQTTVPQPLEDLVGTWHGGNESPEGLRFQWTIPDDPAGAEVFTNIPINHHAAGPTHTRCAVPAAEGSFSVAGEMLTPLAVVTGLEFQGLEHVRVAAAVTSKGCIEFQWMVFHYPDWTYLK
jgi:hypothetical protein